MRVVISIDSTTDHDHHVTVDATEGSDEQEVIDRAIRALTSTLEAIKEIDSNEG